MRIRAGVVFPLGSDRYGSWTTLDVEIPDDTPKMSIADVTHNAVVDALPEDTEWVTCFVYDDDPPDDR